MHVICPALPLSHKASTASPSPRIHFSGHHLSFNLPRPSCTAQPISHNFCPAIHFKTPSNDIYILMHSRILQPFTAQAFYCSAMHVPAAHVFFLPSAQQHHVSSTAQLSHLTYNTQTQPSYQFGLGLHVISLM